MDKYGLLHAWVTGHGCTHCMARTWMEPPRTSETWLEGMWVYKSKAGMENMDGCMGVRLGCGCTARASRRINQTFGGYIGA